jgi:drug/metabolite transporter (DMT)-like permease
MQPPPSRIKTVFALLALYLIWGTTYLAIRYVVEAVPPFMAAAARFICSGSLILLWFKIKSPKKPLATSVEWRSAAITGALLLGGGNGLVSLAETRVSSGMTALFVSSMPFWIVLLDWIRPHGNRPKPLTLLGLMTGLAGMIYLVAPKDNALDSLSVGILICSTISWAAGSLITKHRVMPSSPFLTTGMQMVTGGVFLVLMSAFTGEWMHFSLSLISTQAILGWLYLVFFGSILGYSAYVWLLKHSHPAQATTYAFVNPVVALVLGAWAAHEPLSPRVIYAAFVILSAVAIILTQRASAPKIKA